MINYEDFAKIDIRVGEVVRAERFEKARRPAIKIWVDMGGEIGVRQSSAQLTELYEPGTLIGRQVLAVVNFQPKLIAGFRSEVLVLGIYSNDGVVLISPERKVEKGDKMG
jgi:tRNA-binding protein